MQNAPDFPIDKLTVIAWSNEPSTISTLPITDPYVENYWLGVLGPSATWLLRRIDSQLDASPAGFVMDMAETAQCLGVGSVSKNSPFIRALGRLVQFEMALLVDERTLAVRRRVPSLSRRHLMRLPASVQARHEFWQKKQLTGAG